MDCVSFEATAEDKNLARLIARRAVSIWGNAPAEVLVQMDVIAVHANGCPLRLEALLGADDFNFLHDITGIDRHLNRETGKLEGFFLSRFAQPEDDQ